MHMHHASVLAGLVAVLASSPDARAPATFYVSHSGRDTWSGRLAAPNAARSDGPFATLERARDAARAAKGGGITVTVRGGTYRLSRTFALTEEDSGTAASPVTWRAAPGEVVTLTGAAPVRGWRRGAGGVWTADLKRQGLGDFRFRELFWQGERQTLARFPNLDPKHPVTGGMLYVDEPGQPQRTSFRYAEGAVPFGKWKSWPQAEVVMWPYNCWDHNIVRIADVDTEARQITLRYPVAGKIEVGNRYFVQNVRAAMDAPGEWYSDWRTGQLSFIPPDGRAPRDGDVTVPMLENLVLLSGIPERSIEHVRFQGFHLAGARQDGIVLEGARDCEVVGCTVAQVGGVGINVGFLRNAAKGIGLPSRQGGRASLPRHSGDRALVFSYPCTGCRVVGSDIDSVGGDGIVLGGSGNVADNNTVSRTGIYDRVSAGVTVCGEENRVSHNAIHDVPRDGIFVNGGRNTAEYNDIRNSMLYTADNAAIALRQHDIKLAMQQKGNVLRFNRILDVVGYGSDPHCTHPGDGYASPFCSFGIYLDSFVSGTTVYGNVIARTGGADVFVQFGGGNIVENNIIVEGPAKRVQYDAIVFFGTFMFGEGNQAYRDTEPSNVFRHNVFAYRGPETLLYQVGHWDDPPDWNPRQAVFDDNLIWRGGLPIATNMHRRTICRSLAEWQAKGHDTRSVVADPGFVDAAHDDYRLRPGSPAYGIGFADINADLAKIGPYASADRATWPVRTLALKREAPVVFRFPRTGATIVDGFETTPPGSPPVGMQVSVTPPSVLSTTEAAAHMGRRSLEFTKAPGVGKPWEPHLYCYPRLTEGKVRLSIDVLNRKDALADLYVEFRDWAKELLVGPTFRVDHDGIVYANGRMGAGGQEIGRVPLGEWFTVTMEFALGKARVDDLYTIRILAPGRPDQVATQPYPDKAFTSATWFGISSTGASQSTFYADNLIVGDPASPKGRKAPSAVSIVGPKRAVPATGSRPLAADALAGEWELDDPGYRIADRSGNGLHGAQGGASRATGAFGRALYLPDGGGPASFGDSPLLQFGKGSFSIECWVMPEKLDIASENKRRRVLAKDGYPATYWNVDIWSDGRVMMEMADNARGDGTTTSGGKIAAKCWTHLVVSVDREARSVSYYFDGRLDTRRDLPATFSDRLDVAGASMTTGAWQPFVGLLSDLRIYRRALTAEDAAAHYQAGKARHTSAAFAAEPDE